MAPRFVTHIDDGAIASLTEYYRKVLPSGGAVLDLCSSWISHLPPEASYSQVCGIGMNVRELEANKALSSFEARDLNVDVKLPYADGTFDAVVNAVSVDYVRARLRRLPARLARHAAGDRRALPTLTPSLYRGHALALPPARLAPRADDQAARALRRDAPRAQAGRHCGHVLLQPLLPVRPPSLALRSAQPAPARARVRQSPWSGAAVGAIALCSAQSYARALRLVVSHRSKAVRVWLESDEPGRLAVVANYFHHSVPSGWENIQALDITPLKGDGMAKLKSNPASAFMASFASMDPMYVVEARKAQ